MEKSFERLPVETELIKPNKAEMLPNSEEAKNEEGEIGQSEIIEEKEQLEKIRQELESSFENKEFSEAVGDSRESREEKIKQYQEKYLPKYLRKKQGFIAKTIANIWTRLFRYKTEGKENVPETGPYIVVCNHFGGGDQEALRQTFGKDDLHFAVGKEIWWNQSPILRWIFKKMRCIPVQESLINLSEEEKEAALLRQNGYGKKVFRKIIDREKQGKMTINTEFVRQAVAALSRGDAVGVFPEGLWLDPQGALRLTEKDEMKQGYAGIELIARQYEKLTGQELKIVPTAFSKNRQTKGKKLSIGQPLLLSENDSDKSPIDWCMSHVASMLPEDQRGYYKNLVDKS